MDIKEVQHHKQMLEQQISAAVRKLVEDFKQVTGISPESINIDMRDITTYGYHAENGRYEYTVGDTEVEINV